jgi:hypothetical protein
LTLGDQGTQPIEWFAKPIQHSAEQMWTDRNRRAMPFHQQPAAWPNPPHLSKRHQEHALSAKPDDLGKHGSLPVFARDFA